MTSSNRQSLRHKVTPKLYFVVGSAVHEAIDAQATGKDPYESLEAYVRKERETRVLDYQEKMGSSPPEFQMEDFESAATLAVHLVRQYFDHYGDENPLQDLGLKYVGTEIPFSIPLRNGTDFVGRFDAIAIDIETESQFYLVENKTAAQKPRLDTIQFSNQFVGYNWAFRELTGHTPAGTLYNGIIKRLIKPPKVLKSGKLSVDKQASVTYQSFMDALNYGNHEPIQYLDYMTFLQEREANGDDRFFFREMFTYTNTQLDNWYDRCLDLIAKEIQDINDNDVFSDRIYPNYTSCDGCTVRDLCKAMDYGDDVDSLVSARYEVGRYGTMEAVDGATHHEVRSASDLLEILR